MSDAYTYTCHFFPLWKVCFDLFGVVCHKGNLATSGHYVAYVKRDGWFLVDDQNVSL